MRGLLFLLLAAATGSRGQVNVEIGVAPECPYGYYDVASI
jgi:hypothetical protein